MVPEALQCKQFELANTPMKSELYLGLDVHKEWILVAVAEWGRNGAVHDWGAISNDLHAVEKRLKTDKRDARKLARLLRAGELSAIYIPESTDEAIRDLCRARSDAVDDRRRSRHRLKAFLLRHGYRYQGKSAWSAAHERYLRELMLPHPAMKVILEEYLISVQLASERR